MTNNYSGMNKQVQLKTTDELKDELIKVYGELIERTVKDGHKQMARVYKQHLDTALAMSKLYGL